MLRPGKCHDCGKPAERSRCDPCLAIIALKQRERHRLKKQQSTDERERTRYEQRLAADETVQLLRSIPDFPPMKLEEIADVMGVSKQRIEQIYQRGLKRLRRQFLDFHKAELVKAFGFKPSGVGLAMRGDIWR